MPAAHAVVPLRAIWLGRAFTAHEGTILYVVIVTTSSFTSRCTSTLVTFTLKSFYAVAHPE